MALEIERKFLPPEDDRQNAWRQVVGGQIGSHIVQGYIATRKEGVVRVRIINDSAFLTLKGRNGPERNGPEIRTEFEYPIPVVDARFMLETMTECPPLEKIRYRVPCEDGLVWEVDEFMGRHTGLVLFEIELDHPEQAFPRPDWVGKEVTGDPRYANAVLAASTERAAGLAPEQGERP